MAASRRKKIDQTHLTHCLFTFCFISICQFKCCYTQLEPITCTPVENVRMGDSVGTTVVCHFHKNVYTSRNAFSVVHYPFQASADVPGTDAVVCIWVDADRTRPECAVRDGYRMNYNITTDVIIDILNVTASTAGRYACHLVPLEDRPIEMCHVRIPDPATTTLETTTSSVEIPSGTDANETSESGDLALPIGIGVGVGIGTLLMVTLVTVLCCRKKKTCCTRNTMEEPHTHSKEEVPLTKVVSSQDNKKEELIPSSAVPSDKGTSSINESNAGANHSERAPTLHDFGAGRKEREAAYYQQILISNSIPSVGVSGPNQTADARTPSNFETKPTRPSGEGYKGEKEVEVKLQHLGREHTNAINVLKDHMKR